MSAEDNISCCCLTASFQQTPAAGSQLSLLSLPAKLQMFPLLLLKMGSISHTANFSVFPGFEIDYTQLIQHLAKFRKRPLGEDSASLLLLVCSLTLKKTNFWSITTCFRNDTATKIHQKSERHFSEPGGEKKNLPFSRIPQIPGGR